MKLRKSLAQLNLTVCLPKTTEHELYLQEMYVVKFENKVNQSRISEPVKQPLSLYIVTFTETLRAG